MKTFRIAALLAIATTGIAQAPRPKNGYVPDERTAIRIAEAVLGPIYGEDKIIHERPFHGSLKNGIWTVEGTLPAGMLGGTARIQINKQTGEIISYIHGK